MLIGAFKQNGKHNFKNFDERSSSQVAYVVIEFKNHFKDFPFINSMSKTEFKFLYFF